MSGFAAGSRQYINLGKHCFAVGEGIPVTPILYSSPSGDTAPFETF